jgi:hypothetical protein
MSKLIEWLKAKLFAYLATREKFDIVKTVDCTKCGGYGFETPGTGCDDVCGNCGGQRQEQSIYLRRWYLFKSKRFNIMLHNIKRSDDDPDPHDHPWGFVSIILKNGYLDEQYRFLTVVKDQFRSSPRFWEERAGNFYMEDAYGHFKPLAFERRGVRSGPFFKKVRPCTVVYRRATHIHRVVLKPGKEAWTLVFTGGEKRPWGFVKSTDWVYWRQYLSAWDHKHV